MLSIESVEPGSYVADLGLDQGDRLLSINQHKIEDLIDYHHAVEAGRLVVEILRQDGELWELEIEKEPEEDLGLRLTHPGPSQCGNNCVFCFVHQLPKGLRRTLYVKDEDYRFSYLYGSYITLTNLQEKDYQRIIEQQLSPLYVSVHATETELRRKLLGADVPPILPLIERLTSAGIELHCQIVVCPGYNDKEALEQSISELASFYPKVVSLAVVPVGLTRHREKLPQLRSLTALEAENLVRRIETLQQRYLTELGSRFVYAADELYLQAGAPIPDIECYEDLFQLENGVGMIARFRQQQAEVLLEAEPLELGKVSLVTGVSFCDELQRFAERLSLRTGVELVVLPVANDFFGITVSVTGLLTGSDLISQLRGQSLGDGLLLPDVMLKDDEQLLLDDLSVDELSLQLGVPVIVVESSPWGVFEGLETLAVGPVDIIQC